MDTTEYIESGILELYVFGTLTEAETEEVAKIAAEHKEIRDEIVSIEKAVISLSYSMAPYLSALNFYKIRAKLIAKHDGKQQKTTGSVFSYIGWAAAILLMVGIGFQYTQYVDAESQIVTVQVEKTKLTQEINGLHQKNQKTETVLAVVRDANNIVVPLGGQTVAPEAKAKIYWNTQTQVVYVDASGLPEPPEGKVYQVWALQLSPQLVPTSIGLLSDFKANDHKMFVVDTTAGAQGFGITLEPAGGSVTPSMDQLYALGKV